MSGIGGRSPDKRWRLLAVIGILPVAIAAIFMLTSTPLMHSPETPDWTRVEGVIGLNGSVLPDGTFIISLPRDDIQIIIEDVKLNQEMAMHSWVAFTDMGHEAMMMGDLTLTTEELWITQNQLLRDGIDITAIHNTLNNETPQVFDLHISGKGDPVKMAEAVRNATKAAKITYSDNTGNTSKKYFTGKEHVDQILGTSGTVEGGILQYSIPRAEKIMDDGMELSPYMDVATQLKFQALPENSAAITGEFVMTADEVEPVLRTLNDNGIHVTALHMHMLTEEPRLFYLHFWAVGDQLALARGLRDAVNQTNSVKAGYTEIKK